ncbi:MAG: hypothetical protein ACI4YB_08635 [Oscillospiraceae bacterium]
MDQHYYLMIAAGVLLAIIGIVMAICGFRKLIKSKSSQKQNAVLANHSTSEHSITLSSKQAAEVMELIEALAEIFKNER